MSPDKAIKDGYVVMISAFDADSGQAYGRTVTYNVSRLDEFIAKIGSGKSGRIRIVKYANSSSKTWVNKLYELQSDGKTKTETDYDVYSDPRAFLPFKPKAFYSIRKREYPDGIWYGIRFSKDSEDYASLISFSKNSIVN